MIRSHGRCRRGEQLWMGYPHGHRKMIPPIAGLRMVGTVVQWGSTVPINGDWLEALSAKYLSRLQPH